MSCKSLGLWRIYIYIFTGYVSVMCNVYCSSSFVKCLFICYSFVFVIFKYFSNANKKYIWIELWFKGEERWGAYTQQVILIWHKYSTGNLHRENYYKNSLIRLVFVCFQWLYICFIWLIFNDFGKPILTNSTTCFI